MREWLGDWVSLCTVVIMAFLLFYCIIFVFVFVLVLVFLLVRTTIHSHSFIFKQEPSAKCFNFFFPVLNVDLFWRRGSSRGPRFTKSHAPSIGQGKVSVPIQKTTLINGKWNRQHVYNNTWMLMQFGFLFKFLPLPDIKRCRVQTVLAPAKSAGESYPLTTLR